MINITILILMEICNYGWYYRDNQYYYLDSNVVLVKGWNKITNKWYYFNDQGIMQTGCN